MSNDLAYNTLAGDATSGALPWGCCHRFAVVVSSIAVCLFNAGLAFGFSGLLPVLIANGAFHDRCTDGGENPCAEQIVALTGMFTMATSALNIAAIPSGALLDRFGPRATASSLSLVTAAGCALFARGGQGAAGQFAYTAGFLMLAVAGPAVFTCTLSFGNLFPRRAGLITALLVGCFDASSVVFVGLSLIIDSGVSFADTFNRYARIPVVSSLVAWLLWPRVAVLASGATADVAGQSDVPEGRAADWKAQIATAEFAWLAYTVSVFMVCINFFIATVFPQMQEVEPAIAAELTGVFATVLPAGGLVYFPLIGWLIDGVGPTWGLVVLWCAYIAFQILLALYSLTGVTVMAYGAFAVFAFVRPLFYTLGAAFCGQTFGFETFGKIYGLMTTIAGVANLLVQPLAVLAAEHGYSLTNAMVLGVQLTTIMLPALVLSRSRRKKGVQPTTICSPTSMLARARSDSVALN